jgi:uncharacterized membrane protein YraQ (UPF0718 family)
MSELIDLLALVVEDVIVTFVHVWPFLLISVLAAVFVTVYVGTERVSSLLSRRTVIATGAAVLVATLTPFCSCGTTAVLVGMMASSTPWAPLVAFMVASPLTSPSELALSAGLFGWVFAGVFFVGTIVLGFASGGIAALLDHSGWLKGQARINSERSSCSSGSCAVPEPVGVSIGPGAASITEFPTFRKRWKIDELFSELLITGRKLVLFFFGFTFVGYLAIEAVPTDWLTSYLGGDSLLSVPLAALLGIPAYINTEASLPLVSTLMDGGMGPGPAMAFLVTGAGTSVGAISGLFVIARARVVGLVVTSLLVGAVIMGWIAQIAL